MSCWTELHNPNSWPLIGLEMSEGEHDEAMCVCSVEWPGGVYDMVSMVASMINHIYLCVSPMNTDVSQYSCSYEWQSQSTIANFASLLWSFGKILGYFTADIGCTIYHWESWELENRAIVVNRADSIAELKLNLKMTANDSLSSRIITLSLWTLFFPPQNILSLIVAMCAAVEVTHSYFGELQCDVAVPSDGQTPGPIH